MINLCSAEFDARKNSMFNKLKDIYGEERASFILDEIINLIEKYSAITGQTSDGWVNENDVVLITYGDNIKENNKPPLSSLKEFSDKYLSEVINSIHILPFYPYSSDDGFSVIDYYQVDPALGGWKEIENLSKDYKLMFDGVINHISAGSEWFKQYLSGNPKYSNYFIESDPDADYSTVTRPRTLPLLSEFETAHGNKYILTTFSEDQIDLNFANEKVLLEITELILFYISKGAKLLRLDAIGYLWKKLGTSCIHLDEAHKIIQLFREIVDIVAPATVIITETNVPHKDNISYFGDGTNEAHMVYQFSLPPLTLNAFHSGKASHLLNWADSLEFPEGKACFFNFLSSHDGIGVMPAKGILSDEEINDLVEKVKEHGGFVSYKNNGDGTQSPYELNINYFDALSHPDDSDEIKIKLFLAAHSLLISMAGMPAIYIHSLLGSRNYHKGVEITGRYRSINREKLDRKPLEAELENTLTLRNKVFAEFSRLIKIRKSQGAFSPNASKKVLKLNESIFSIIRSDEKEKILVLINVAANEIKIDVPMEKTGLDKINKAVDLVSGAEIIINNGSLALSLAPYQVMWIKG